MKIDTNLLLLGGAGLALFLFFGNKSTAAGKKVTLVPGKTYEVILEGTGGFTFDPSKLDANRSVLESLGMSVKNASLKNPELLSVTVIPTKQVELVVGLPYRPDPLSPSKGFTYTSVREI